MQIHYSLLIVVSSVDYFFKKLFDGVLKNHCIPPWTCANVSLGQTVYICAKTKLWVLFLLKKSYVTKNKTKYYIGALIFNLTIIVWNWSFKCLLIWANPLNSSTEIALLFLWCIYIRLFGLLSFPKYYFFSIYLFWIAISKHFCL